MKESKRKEILRNGLMARCWKNQTSEINFLKKFKKSNLRLYIDKELYKKSKFDALELIA